MVYVVSGEGKMVEGKMCEREEELGEGFLEVEEEDLKRLKGMVADVDEIAFQFVVSE